MTAIGVGISYILNNGKQALVIEIRQWTATGVEGKIVRNGQDLSIPNAEVGPKAVIIIVLEGDQSVEPVVAAGQLDKHQNGAVLFRKGGSGQGRLGEELGSHCRKGNQAQALEGLF